MRYIEGNWSQQSACRDAEEPDNFFIRVYDLEGPLADRRAEVRYRQNIAKSLCATCPVRAECLEDAYQRYLEDPVVHAIAGGLTQREQRALFKQRKKAARVLARAPGRAA